MKFHNISRILIVTLLLASCTETEKKDIESKKKQLAGYKTSLKELSGKIEALEKELTKEDTSFKVEQKSKLVQVSVLKREDFKHYIEVQGAVDAEENVTALPQQPGIVTSVLVKVGDKVTKGQLIGTTATTATIEDQLQSAQAQQALATTAYDKQKNLWDQKIGSEIQFLQAKTQKETAEKGVDALKKQIEMTKITAPISGTVDLVNLRVGDMAAPSQLMPGIRIVNGESLKVKARLADSDYGKIKQGDIVEVDFPDIDNSVTLPVSYVSRTIDTRSRTFGVEAKLPNERNIYAANMIAKLKINDEVIKKALVVPSNIIQKSANGAYVLVASIDNNIKTAHKKMVVTGVDFGGKTVITSGLNEGDLIIIYGYSEVVDGQRIDY